MSVGGDEPPCQHGRGSHDDQEGDHEESTTHRNRLALTGWVKEGLTPDCDVATADATPA
jgi:hypothetical protein